MRNSSGFTLVELMVVVAIIGILAAVGVPSFKKYQNKTKQAEAKIQLAAVYNTEIAAQSAYDSFGTCIMDLGYEPAPRGYYMIGFAAIYNAGILLRAPTCGAVQYYYPGGVAGANGTVGTMLKPGWANPVPWAGTGATTSTFSATASASLIPASTLPDMWTINELKVLTNVSAGI